MYWLRLFLGILVAGRMALSGQRQIICPSGEHRQQWDAKELAIQYSGQEMVSTLNTLGILGARLTSSPKTLQTAAAATQIWNEYLKGLASAWNACAISSDQAAEALKELYPALREDASRIGGMRSQLEASRQSDGKALLALLEKYLSKLERFAEIANSAKLFRQYSILSGELAKTFEEVHQVRQEQQLGFENIEARQDRIQQSLDRVLGPEVIRSALQIKMSTRADQAEVEYKLGFANLNAFRIREAVVDFERASELVPMPEFSLALGTALWLLPDLKRAERVLVEGQLSAQKDGANNALVAASIAGQLGLVLHDKGDLRGAQEQEEFALRTELQFHGRMHPNVAACFSNLGEIFRFAGDLKSAENYTEQALEIADQLNGPDGPTIATVASNLGQIYEDEERLPEARKLTERALRISIKAHGKDSVEVALVANNLGRIMRDEGDMAGAKEQTERALKNYRNVLGPDCPEVATAESNLALILQLQGELEGCAGTKPCGSNEKLKDAQERMEFALHLAERLFGEMSPSVAIYASSLGQVLMDRGQFQEARKQAERALRISKALYGSESPQMVIVLDGLGKISANEGRIEDAKQQFERALHRSETVFGPQYKRVAVEADNLGQMLAQMGNLTDAREQFERALGILVTHYGKDTSEIQRVRENLDKVRQAERAARRN